MALPRYEIFKDTKNEYRFRLLAVNGQIILNSSEGYSSKDNCKRAVAICQENSPYEQYYFRGYSNNHYWFTLKAVNGLIVGMSEMYTTSYNRDNGIDAVKRDGRTQNVEDKS